MSASGEQLPLALPAISVALTRGAFLEIGPAGEALRLADAWRASDDDRLVICGAAGSGKSHLAAIIAAEGDPAGRSLEVYDDVHKVGDPRALLHALEQARDAGARVVMVGRGAPADWARDLTDLATRLEATSRICMREPDEELISALIQKRFTDRQLTVDPSVVAFAAARLPRTFAAAQGFVAAADAASARLKRRISKQLAGDVINDLSSDPR